MGVVVAVSVARPCWQEVYGRQVHTSIVRDASDQPVHFGAGGPEGNATAVHTEEVFAFFAEHYDYWTDRLGTERAAWGACHWGENLMLSGMPGEGDLHIGDRFRVGEALLEVTSPRIPCFKLSWRIGQPESFLRTLIESGRMGCYLRVIEPGNISAGDRVRPDVRADVRADAAISVLALSRLLHDPDVTDLDILRRVLATPGLGGQAAGMIRKRIAFLTDGRLGARGRWQGWRKFEVAGITDEARDIRSFRLRPVDGAAIGGYRAGQFLTVRLPDAGGTIRSWSLSDYDQSADHYRISIKRDPQGTASRWMHEVAKLGDRLDIRPPSGRFLLDRSGFMRTVLISAGIGVTPMIAMLKAHAERGAEAPPLLWLHAAQSGAEHGFAREVDALLATMPNAVRRIFYSRPAPGDANHDRVGRLDAEAVAEMLVESYSLSPFGRAIELTGDYSDFYLCGPRSFEDDVRRALMAHGVNPETIRSERFGAGDPVADGPPAPEAAEVRFGEHNLTWQRDDDLTLLELAEAAGIAVDSACRAGSCGTCEVGLRAGSVRYLLTPSAAPGEGRVLLCCAQPASTMLELELTTR